MLLEWHVVMQHSLMAGSMVSYKRLTYQHMGSRLVKQCFKALDKAC